MPKPVKIRASGAHRVACLSLYRALLKQISALVIRPEFSSSATDPLQGLLRYSFRRDRTLVSPSQIANGLKAGRDALNLLQLCSEQSPSALNRLTALVESMTQKIHDIAEWRSTLVKIRSPTSKEKLSKIAHLQATSRKASQTRYPGSKPILERPLPLSEIKGEKRRVPYLVAPHGIPFLRYGKPQPISLSRYIRQRVRDDIKTWKQKDGLEPALALASYEDEWDQIMCQKYGIRDRQPASKETPETGRQTISAGLDEPSWRIELEVASRDLSRKIKEKDLKNTEMGRKMWEVVVKERELAAQEKKQRLQAKWAAKQLKQQQSTSIDPFQGDFGDNQALLEAPEVQYHVPQTMVTTTI